VGVDSVSASEGEKKEVIAEEASVGKDSEAVDMEAASAAKDSEAASVAKDSEATDITIITTTTEVLEASDTEADSKDKIYNCDNLKCGFTDLVSVLLRENKERIYLF
jgi:hypothetical protein